MASLLTAPLELIAKLMESAQALAEFPATLERTLRETNALIGKLAQQLDGVQGQIDRIVTQLDAVAPHLDALRAQVGPLVEVADGARQHLVTATTQLATTAHDLERIANIAEPLDAVSKRVVDQFRRVTGRRDPS